MKTKAIQNKDPT